MIWVTENRPTFSVQSLIEQVITAGQISRRDHMNLTSAILADQRLTDEERRHISRVLDYVQIGRLKLVD